MMSQYIGHTLQALTVAAVLWTGSTIQEVSKVIALHEWRITALEKVTIQPIK